ncbi:MAG: Snf7 family protein [Candidatus Bathyarchaeia archaeon]|jgi:division protein CdvB (Snf7/Vps24/ESCRT-III family)
MNQGFLKDWDRDEREPVFSRVGDRFHHKPAVKEQISSALYRLNVQKNKLETAASRMQQHDKDIFAKCINSQMAHDNARAMMYANECAEVRKMAKVTVQCQMALEQVYLRLQTIEEFGDVAKMMAPVASVVHSIKSQISGVMPEVGFELGQIGEVLSGVVDEAGEVTGSNYDVNASSEEAQRILGEANTISEQHMKNIFPDLPSNGSVSRQKVGEAGISH